MAIPALDDLRLPAHVELHSAKRDNTGETNDVFSCHARWQGREISCYLKVGRQEGDCLGNEAAVLKQLETSPIPVPTVIWYHEGPPALLIVETIPGHIVWDYIDPRRPQCDTHRLAGYLRSYGRCLAQIHELPLAWPDQKRRRLESLADEQDVSDPASDELVAWLGQNAPRRREEVFVHGDFNTASVLFRDGRLTGVIDWEFAGRGWREYDLAWTLRARTTFLNTPAEHEAIVEGYCGASHYDPDALRWCEVLNYLHFAHWCREREPDYAAFALARARTTAASG